MTQVWVIVSEFYSPRDVLGIFSTLELAKSASDRGQPGRWEQSSETEWLKWWGSGHGDEIVVHTLTRWTMDSEPDQ